MMGRIPIALLAAASLIACGGTDVLFTTTAPGPQRGVYFVPDDGGTPTKISVSGHSSPRDAAWSPDRSSIVFINTTVVDGCCNNTDIFTASRNGTNVRVLTKGLCISGATGCNELNPAWASTGEIAFEVEPFGSDQQLTFPKEIGVLRNGRIVNLTEHGAADVEPAWNSTGDWIAFASNRSGNWDIWIMDASGGQLQQITDTPESERSPTWVRIGGEEQIAFVGEIPAPPTTAGGGTFRGIKVADRAGNLIHCSSAAGDSSPAGKSALLAFVSDRSGSDEVYLAPANACGSNARALTSNGWDKTGVSWD